MKSHKQNKKFDQNFQLIITGLKSQIDKETDKSKEKQHILIEIVNQIEKS